MLLSFAQFEREVTGERKLVINEPEAEQVRKIMQPYLTANSVPELVEILARNASYTKLQKRKNGETKGGVHFKRGNLYHLLSNRIYRGMKVHKGEAFEGELEAIATEELWNDVQTKLAKQGQGGS